MWNKCFGLNLHLSFYTQLRSHIEQIIDTKLEVFKAVQYRSQLVSGFNYVVKVNSDVKILRKQHDQYLCAILTLSCRFMWDSLLFFM